MQSIMQLRGLVKQIWHKGSNGSARSLGALGSASGTANADADADTEDADGRAGMDDAPDEGLEPSLVTGALER